MAKIKKIKEGTATVYPATIPQAVIDPTSGKSVRTELNEKEAVANKKQTVTNSATDYPSGAAVAASLALKTDISELNKIYPLYNYNVRLGLDSGTVGNLEKLTKLYNENLALLDSTVFLWSGVAGMKTRTSGGNQFASKIYNMANKVQQFGSELVTNGTFTTNTSGWIAISGATLSVDTARLKVTNTAGTYGGAQQQFTTVIGKTYHLAFTFTLGAGDGRVTVGDSPGTSTLYKGPKLTANTTTTISFIASSTLTYLSLTSSSISNTDFALYDNISVRQMDWIDGTNDAIQTTEANQPYVGGTIAPNEVRNTKYSSTQSNTASLVYSNQTFAQNEDWSMVIAFKINGKITGRAVINLSSTLTLDISLTTINLLIGGTTLAYCLTTVESGKTHILEYKSNKGVVSLKINNSSKTVITLNQLAVTFGRISNNTQYPFDGNIYHFQILNKYLSEVESQVVHDYLRSQIPEIEGIAIGNQYWATSNYEGVVAGDGSVIPEVQNSDNVEKITDVRDREFSEDTGFWVKSGNTVISGGFARIQSDGVNRGRLFATLPLPRGCYIVTYTVLSTNNSPDLWIDGQPGGLPGKIPSTLGTHTVIIKPANWHFQNLNLAATSYIDVDNISIQEVGWSQSTTIYDAIYAQTSGTAAQKELAALKAAAMWCYYDNDVNNGAIYGKLYNWYAVKLISLYPPTGYRVPTESDLNQLANYLGGSAVAGGKMKKDGLTYWDTPNTGATNESGFSVIGSGRRISTGYFNNIKVITKFWCITAAGNLAALELKYNDASVYAIADNVSFGYPTRLLRNSPVGPNETTVTTGTIVNALGAGNLDIVIPFGYAVDSIKVISKTGITGLSAKYCSRNPSTLAVTELDTLFTAKTVVADTPKLFNCNVDQTIKRQDAVVRINGTKADTAAEFEVIVNIKKAIL